MSFFFLRINALRMSLFFYPVSLTFNWLLWLKATITFFRKFPMVFPGKIVNPSLYFHSTFYNSQWLPKAMAPHSSTLAWKIPWMEEPGGLLSMGSHKVGHDWCNLAAAAAAAAVSSWLSVQLILGRIPRLSYSTQTESNGGGEIGCWYQNEDWTLSLKTANILVNIV